MLLAVDAGWGICEKYISLADCLWCFSRIFYRLLAVWPAFGDQVHEPVEANADVQGTE
jgi:hypothetical protein